MSDPISLRDIEILMGEGLYEEAEKRLIHYLTVYPRDEKATQHLAKVERQLFVRTHLRMKIPDKREALRELKRLAGFEEAQDALDPQWTTWLSHAPKEWVVDLTVSLGSLGLHALWENVLNEWPLSEVPTQKAVEAFGWMGRFYYEDGDVLRARQWLEKALALLPSVPRTVATSESAWKRLECELNFLYAQCFWELGERSHALTQMQELAKKYPKDHTVMQRLQAMQQDV